MIRSLGHEYTVKLNVSVEIKVTGHSGDDAGDNAVEAVEEALRQIGAEAEAEVLELERGDEALDVTEDE